MPLWRGAGPIRIVIADDDSLFARRARARLARDDVFEVVGIAADGQEAVQLAEELEPDLIMIDAGRRGPAVMDVILAVSQLAVAVS